MATNIKLDDELVARAIKLGQHKTPQEAVAAAVKEYVTARQPGHWEKWIGKVKHFDDVEPAPGRRTPKKKGRK